MMDRLRVRLDSVLEELGRSAARLMPNPSHWTILGFMFSVAAGFIYSIDMPVVGGVMLLFSGAMDILDGAVARSVARVSRAGAFLDSVMDRASEVAVFAGIAFGGLAEAWIVVLTLALSMLVSYSRARLEGLSSRRPKGLEMGERAERILVLAILSLVGQVRLALLVVLAIAIETFMERAIIYYRSLATTRT